ncbi:GspH/FimT family pseudopilin [Cupriavidus oxalaticus]|uniref:Type II secretion system protein H n=1 Tax=Cupriavidus oxalaticus TaxID=96344 RepID=A0A976B8J3_9BURK|nr:GspH/FimT family pseudopilin [Cupriavidus oxalaticus]QRQ87571.1 prepilin-type N-terminal cleavage/methylation domain-containing protein [Cupriavidus oxalaticus]QRQ94101.1 prepilin-type N-terminal cleavage/methylation domain-containing protein [Cupriavidus oxalaticus]WQD82736.1 GspH/FimT family pseudopilin [Cupriavidus oxalaticus]SPC10640.1 GENERAL SECRETORY PATHWAY H TRANSMEMBRANE PROTEIN, type II secretion system [Cupriavidus oxalaticus]
MTTAPRRRAPLRPRGFTLLELLVVMVIAGIVISLVAINASPNERGRVLDDGQRIARLFELAQEEAQLGARPIAWEGDAGGWRFLESTPNGWIPMRTDVFAPGRWRLALDQVLVAEGGRPTGTGGPLRLVFGRELIDMPQRLILVRGNIRVDVTGDGGGRYFASTP